MWKSFEAGDHWSITKQFFGSSRTPNHLKIPSSVSWALLVHRQCLKEKFKFLIRRPNTEPYNFLIWILRKQIIVLVPPLFSAKIISTNAGGPKYLILAQKSHPIIWHWHSPPGPSARGSFLHGPAVPHSSSLWGCLKYTGIFSAWKYWKHFQ